MANSRLAARLAAVRARLLTVGMIAGLCWGLLVCLVLLVAGVWLDLLWELSPQARAALPLLALLVGLALASLVVAAAARRWRIDRVVRRYDEAGGCGGLIVSGWELSLATAAGNLRPGRPSADGGITAGLAALAVESATRRADDVPLSQVIDARPLRMAALWMLGTAAVIGLLAVLLPAVTATEWRRFSNPFGDVPPFSTIEFEVEPGDTQVVYGNGLDITAVVSGAPVERVELVYVQGEQQQTLPMFPETGGRWRAALSRVVEEARYFVRAEAARSTQYKIGVITTPRISEVRFRVTPPAYTRDAAYEGPLPQGGLAGLAGAEVQVWADSNRPLSGGLLRVWHGDDIVDVPLKSSAGQQATGRFTIRQNGKFTLRVTDVAGQSSQDELAGTITRLVDQRPFLRLLQPKANSLATPDAQLPVEIAAEDDYGVTRLQLYRSLNNSRALPLDFAAAQPPPRRRQEQVYLPLAEYGLTPGDEIKLFARVEDNDPAGAKGTESSPVTVRIISPEELQRMQRIRHGLEMLVSKYRQAERRMEGLANEMEELRKKLAETPPDSPAAQQLRQELARLAADMRRQAEAIERAAEQVLPYDLDRNMTQHLTRLADQMQQAAQALEQLQKNDALTNSELEQQLGALAMKLGAARKQFQQEAAEPIELFAGVFPLLENQSRFVQLVARQVELADRLASLKGRDGEDDPALKARMRDLEDEQRRIRQTLDELLEDIEVRAMRLPDEPELEDLRKTALKFVDAVHASGAAEAMASAEVALAEFSGTRGYNEARRAADLLLELLQQAQQQDGMNMGQQGRASLVFNPSLQQGLGQTISQMLSESGLGQGRGSGAGGGFSTRRSTLNNIGLYGGTRPGGEESLAGAAGDKAGGDGPGSFAARAGSNFPSLIDAAVQSDAAGGAQGAVPLNYRRRVGQYFQRLAEELQ